MSKFITIPMGVCLLTVTSLPSLAHPVFAERHNMRCSACHVTPIVDGAPLNSNGRNFRNNGYKFGNNNGGGNNGGGNNGGGNNDNCLVIGQVKICQ